MKTIRIIGVPAGEAPEHVRQAWVGLTLPVLRGPMRFPSIGVVTGPKTYFGGIAAFLTGRTSPAYGYAVDTRTAVDVLAAANPEAAHWWRANVPHLFKSGQALIFDAEVCQEEPSGATTG